MVFEIKVDPKKDMIYVNGTYVPQERAKLNLIKEISGNQNLDCALFGCLDVATPGLISVTNDGEFPQKNSHPSSGLSKELSSKIPENSG
ncbi:pseudouridine synthase, RluC/RluD [Artemisia annua]|uniref:Pseudouridine synthase, RluC/RluD n=1 Tax=Artemisia annua TaxID=35608 RepID=A0A2U1QKS1_ARTAN|nr:pseudouridine synthase, RluC/RluD [Artemisia annua]